MRYYFAPMEGITGVEYRTLHAKYFPGLDRYYLPFLSPTQEHKLTPRQRYELEPRACGTAEFIPQILTASAEDFVWAAEALGELGYGEVNLNLGCPSGTVVSKGKGAGMLRDVDALDRFLETVFSRCRVRLSVKTRLGLTDPEEFEKIYAVLSRYPFCELILHPRTRKEMYTGAVHRDVFEQTEKQWQGDLCYNGNLFTRADLKAFVQTHPNVASVMLGRGMLADPALVCKYRGKPVERQTLRDFHEALCAAYLARLHPNQAVLPKMKELWFYLCHSFETGDAAFKKLRKARYWTDFYALTQQVFETLPLRETADFTQ